MNDTNEVMTAEEKNPESEKSSDYMSPLDRLKAERALKKEKKKAVKSMTAKFGSPRLAKRMVKVAVRNINTRRSQGRGG
jgi:hypothetical protein